MGKDADDRSSNVGKNGGGPCSIAVAKDGGCVGFKIDAQERVVETPG
jgi:hypothetical protein